MRQNENDQNHKSESTPVVDNKPNGNPRHYDPTLPPFLLTCITPSRPLAMRR
jgi:hypothetical protein